jgi:manganese/zinc/iron transport system permease protein
MMKAVGLLVCFLWIASSAWAIKGSQFDGDFFIPHFSKTFLYAMTGSLLMAISNGILGAFLVVRQMAMLGDVVSHAVLPGLVAGFMLAQGKSLPVMMLGAIASGVLGLIGIRAIQKYTRLKEDVALGLILSGFYAVGVCLLAFVQHQGVGASAGLDKILLGQAAAIQQHHLWAMVGVVGALLVGLWIFYKEWILLSFDTEFSKSLHLPVRFLEGLFLGLVTANIAVGLQSSGVLLVSAMLVIPASTAYLWTKKFKMLLWLSIGVNAAASLLGTYLSSLRPGIPTGPCMVMVAGSFFILLWVFGPKHGWLRRWLRRRHFEKQVKLENVLKLIFHFLENHPGIKPSAMLPLKDLAQSQGIPYELMCQACKSLENKQWACLEQKASFFGIRLTAKGYWEAIRVVRKHRLWELYLSSAANYPLDHVHEDAESAEHLIDEATLRKLEVRLNFPTKDPHGKVIPVLPTSHENIFLCS